MTPRRKKKTAWLFKTLNLGNQTQISSPSHGVYAKEVVIWIYFSKIWLFHYNLSQSQSVTYIPLTIQRIQIFRKKFYEVSKKSTNEITKLCKCKSKKIIREETNRIKWGCNNVSKILLVRMGWTVYTLCNCLW